MDTSSTGDSKQDLTHDVGSDLSRGDAAKDAGQDLARDAGQDPAKDAGHDAGQDLAPPIDARPDAQDGGPIKSCSKMSECECLVSSGCLPITTACWCPAACLPGILCGACGGGSFLGCVQLTSCDAPLCSLLDRISGPSEAGCYSCQPQDDCAAAHATLQTRCGLYAGDVAALSCDKNAACVLDCLNKLESCSEIDCRFCKDCTCTHGPSPFSNCYAACQQ